MFTFVIWCIGLWFILIFGIALLRIIIGLLGMILIAFDRH